MKSVMLSLLVLLARHWIKSLKHLQITPCLPNSIRFNRRLILNFSNRRWRTRLPGFLHQRGRSATLTLLHPAQYPTLLPSQCHLGHSQSVSKQGATTKGRDHPRTIASTQCSYPSYRHKCKLIFWQRCSLVDQFLFREFFFFIQICKLNKKPKTFSTPGISSLSGQGHVHFAKGTYIGKSLMFRKLLKLHSGQNQ